MFVNHGLTFFLPVLRDSCWIEAEIPKLNSALREQEITRPPRRSRGCCCAKSSEPVGSAALSSRLRGKAALSFWMSTECHFPADV